MRAVLCVLVLTVFLVAWECTANDSGVLSEVLLPTTGNKAEDSKDELNTAAPSEKSEPSSEKSSPATGGHSGESLSASQPAVQNLEDITASTTVVADNTSDGKETGDEAVPEPTQKAQEAEAAKPNPPGTGHTDHATTLNKHQSPNARGTPGSPSLELKSHQGEKGDQQPVPDISDTRESTRQGQGHELNDKNSLKEPARKSTPQKQPDTGKTHTGLSPETIQALKQDVGRQQPNIRGSPKMPIGNDQQEAPGVGAPSIGNRPDSTTSTDSTAPIDNTPDKIPSAEVQSTATITVDTKTSPLDPSSTASKTDSTPPLPLPLPSTALPLLNSVDKTDGILCSSSLFALAALATLAVAAAAPAH